MGNILNNNNDNSLSYQFDNKLAEVFDAIPIGDMEKIANYIQSGKNLDLTDDRSEVDNELNEGKGETLLLRAIAFGDPDIMRMLIDAGANVNIYNNRSGETPLLKAIDTEYVDPDGDVDRERTIDIMRMLIDAGANPNIGHNISGETPLLRAINNRDTDMVRMLIYAGADPNIGNNEIGIPLYIAVLFEDLFLMQILINAGANIHQLVQHAVQGEITPLHMATEFRKVESVKFLLEQGADRNIKNGQNHTACDIAESIGHQELIELLCEHHDDDTIDLDQDSSNDSNNDGSRVNRVLFYDSDDTVDFDNLFNFNDSSLNSIVEDLL